MTEGTGPSRHFHRCSSAVDERRSGGYRRWKRSFHLLHPQPYTRHPRAQYPQYPHREIPALRNHTPITSPLKKGGEGTPGIAPLLPPPPTPLSLPVPPIPPPGNWVTGGRTGSEGTTRRGQVLIRTPRLIRMQPLCLARPSGRPGLPATGICPSPPRPPARPPVSGRGRGTSCSLKTFPWGSPSRGPSPSRRPSLESRGVDSSCCLSKS